MDATVLRDLKSTVQHLQQIIARLETTVPQKVVEPSKSNGADGIEDGDVLMVKVFDKTIRCKWTGNGECNRCGAQILWVTTPKGKNMPLDPEADDDGVYTSHFGSCKAKAAR